MEKIKQLEEQLSSMIQTQLCNPEYVDTKELGEVVDMLKDLSEFCYYKTITEAMEGKDKEENSGKKEVYYYTMPDYRFPGYRNEDIYYYGGNDGGHGGSRMYSEGSMNMIRDAREGKSPLSRKMYMESKEMHQGTAAQMKELEKYMNELTKDIMEMIEGASPEERQVLQQKISTLAQKIDK